MLITDERFFCEEIDKTIPELANIADTYRNKGLEAAEKQLCDYVRATLRPQDYFKIPYYERENAWALESDDDFAAAEKIIRGQLRSVAVTHDFGSIKNVDFTFNPTYNNYMEWTWQLSRHHEWRCIGRCYRETGDEKYAQAFVDYLMLWCEQALCPEENKGGTDVCWRTIEAGIRMTKNWHYAFFACYKSPAMTDHVMTTYLKSIWEHGDRLHRFHAQGNWLIMEMSGLSHIGMLYPFLVKAKSWADYAFGKLSDELDIQVYPDGFQFELSTNYHNVVTQNYHWVLCTAHAIGYKYPEALSAKIKSLFDLNIKIVCPDNKFFDLNDGARAGVDFWCQMALRYFPDDQVYRYFATNGKEGTPPDFKSIALPYAGQAYMRTGWNRGDMLCFIDAGPYGRAHQHEDKLNVLMFAYGKEVLKDMGNYAYDNSDMRKFVLDTYAHNCGLVDDLPQRRRKGYTWLPELIKKRSDMKWGFTEQVDSAEGIYNEGFGLERVPVTQKRKLIFFKSGVAGSKPFAAVVDRFVSEDDKEHTFTVSYHMNTQPYTVRGKEYRANMGDGVTMSLIGTSEPAVLVAQKEPVYIGWRPRGGANSYDFEHYHAPCIQYSEIGKEKRIVTVLYPSNDGNVEIKGVEASTDIADSEFTLVFADGKRVKINENDYPCSFDADEKFNG